MADSEKKDTTVREATAICREALGEAGDILREMNKVGRDLEESLKDLCGVINKPVPAPPIWSRRRRGWF